MKNEASQYLVMTLSLAMLATVIFYPALFVGVTASLESLIRGGLSVAQTA